MRTTTFLRKRLESEGILVAPGAYNALTAKLVVQAGFEVVYVTGAGIANTLLGLPDVGLVSFGEMRDQIRYITQAVEVPVIVDADTGYGNSINVYRTVRELEIHGKNEKTDFLLESVSLARTARRIMEGFIYV